MNFLVTLSNHLILNSFLSNLTACHTVAPLLVPHLNCNLQTTQLPTRIFLNYTISLQLVIYKSLVA